MNGFFERDREGEREGERREKNQTYSESNFLRKFKRLLCILKCQTLLANQFTKKKKHPAVIVRSSSSSFNITLK